MTTAFGTCPPGFDAARVVVTNGIDPARALLDTLAFWRTVANGAAPDHPSHVVVRVLEGPARREENRA